MLICVDWASLDASVFRLRTSDSLRITSHANVLIEGATSSNAGDQANVNSLPQVLCHLDREDGRFEMQVQPPLQEAMKAYFKLPDEKKLFQCGASNHWTTTGD